MPLEEKTVTTSGDPITAVGIPHPTQPPGHHPLFLYLPLREWEADETVESASEPLIEHFVRTIGEPPKVRVHHVHTCNDGKILHGLCVI